MGSVHEELGEGNLGEPVDTDRAQFAPPHAGQRHELEYVGDERTTIESAGIFVMVRTGCG